VCTRSGDDLRRILVACLQPIDDFPALLFALFALFLLFPERLLGAPFAFPTFGFFMLFEGLSVLLLALDVEFN
jgi:hypothetical protein